MKNTKKLFAFLLAVLMIAGIAGCSNSQAADESTKPEEVVEDVVPADTEEPVEDLVEDEPEVVTLTEEDLKDFVQFSNLYVQRRKIVDKDVLETDEAIGDTESENIAEEVDTLEETIPEDDVSETDAESAEKPDEASDEIEEIVDPDPYGYLAAVKILNPVVVRDITYDDTLVDVRVVGDYELFYLAVVDEDAYNEALLSPVTDTEDSEEPAMDEEIEAVPVEEKDVEAKDAVDVEATNEPSTELPEPEHIIYGEIHKVVRIVEPEEYEAMLENGDIIEVVDGTAVLAPESEIAEVDIEDVEFTRPEGFEESAEDTSYIPSFKDESGQAIEAPKPTPSGGGGGNSGNNNNSDNNFDDTGSENKTPSPTATEKPKETETPKPQDTTKPTEMTKPTTPPAPTATPHTHTWVTETIYHDEVSHEEPVYEDSPVYGTESYYVVDTPAWSEVVGGGIKCLGCGRMYSSGDDWMYNDTCDSGYTIVEGQTIYHDEVGHYETREVQTGTTQVQVGTTTVVDSPAWTETITKCSGCGALK